MDTINEPNHPTDYRIVKLMDGSLLMGTISVDDNHMRIENPLELTTIPRMTEYGLKEDTTLAQWIPFTSDKEFVITKDKIVVISLATVELAHFYEVVLSKLQNDNQRVRPVLTPEAIDRILDIADEMDEMDNMEFMRDDEPHDMIGGYTIQSKKLH
jgi:hypothetical protein